MTEQLREVLRLPIDFFNFLEGRGNKGRKRDLKQEGEEEEEELGFGEEKKTAEEEMQDCAMFGPFDSAKKESGRGLSNNAAAEPNASQNQKRLKNKERRRTKNLHSGEDRLYFIF